MIVGGAPGGGSHSNHPALALGGAARGAAPGQGACRLGRATGATAPESEAQASTHMAAACAAAGGPNHACPTWNHSEPLADDPHTLRFSVPSPEPIASSRSTRAVARPDLPR